jgi:hypothetical protein
MAARSDRLRWRLAGRDDLHAIERLQATKPAEGEKVQ